MKDLHYLTEYLILSRKYTIDLCILDERNISLAETVALISLNDNDVDFEIPSKVKDSLQDKKYIKLISENNKEIIIIREKGKLLLNDLQTFTPSISKRVIKKVIAPPIDNFDEFITEFRQLWKGLRPGSMGAQNGCAEKMRRWMLTNPNYTQQDILKAAKT